MDFNNATDMFIQVGPSVMLLELVVLRTPTTSLAIISLFPLLEKSGSHIFVPQGWAEAILVPDTENFLLRELPRVCVGGGGVWVWGGFEVSRRDLCSFW